MTLTKNKAKYLSKSLIMSTSKATEKGHLGTL